MILSVVAGAACSGSSDTPLLNTDCTINSDCNDPLACVFKRCHTKCTSSRDCNANERCVQAKDIDTGKVLGNVCQLPEETRCHINSDCPDNLICGVDGQCRNQCDQNKDCVGGQICTAHTCADPVELDDAGMLMQVIDGGTTRDGIPLSSDAATLPQESGSDTDAGRAGAGGTGGGGSGGSAGNAATGGNGGNAGDAVTAGSGGSSGTAGSTSDGGPTDDVSQATDSGGDAGVDASVSCATQPAGTPCGTNLVCSAAQCVFCQSDAPCSNGTSCKAFRTSCSTGFSVCKATVDNAVDYTSCGVNNYCLAGQCLACSAGTACTPANECHKGQIVCSADAGPICNDIAQNASDDTPCQGNKVCATGICVAANRTLTVTQGQSQTATIDGLLAAPVQITLTDNASTPVPGKTVTLISPPGAGARPFTAVTDAQGNVNLSPRVGLAVGSYEFTATGEGAAALKFTATAAAPVAGTVFSVVNTDHAAASDGVPGPATLAHISGPVAFAAASDGSIYVDDFGGGRVLKLSTEGALTLVAGTGGSGSTGDGAPATSAQIGRPFGIALDESTSSLYISDYQNSVIRRVDLVTGLISTFAGGGSAPSPGFGDSGFRTAAVLASPTDVSIGPDHGLYISDAAHNRIRRVAPSGIIDAWLDLGDCTDSAALAGCYLYGEGCAVTWDSSGAAFIAGQICGTSPGGTVYGVIRKPPTGPLTHVTGHAASGSSAADGVPATLATYTATPRLAFDAAGNLFVSAYGDHKIRRIDGVDTRIKTIAGDGTAAFLGDYVDATASRFNNPSGMLVLPGGHLMIADYTNHAARIIWGAGTSTASTATLSISSGNNQSVRVDEFAAPLSVKLVDGANKGLSQALVQWSVVDTGGALYSTSSVTALSGIGSATVRPGLAVGAYRFRGKVTDLHGFDVTGSPAEFTVNATAPSTGDIFTVVDADHSPADNGLNGPGILAHVRNPWGVATASDGTIYMSDRSSHRVTMLTPKGVLVTIAGNGTAGNSGDGGLGSSAQLNSPSGIALDEANGYLYIADSGNNRIRVIALADDSISTYAGGAIPAPPGPGYGDSGPAINAALSNPGAIAINPVDGALYIADTGHNEIRKVATNTFISTFVTPAAACTDTIDLYSCQYGCGITFDAAGNAYISGWICGTSFVSSSAGVVKRSTTNGAVSWIGGRPLATATSTEGGDATGWFLGDYQGFTPLAFGGGDLYVALNGYNRVGRINLATGKFSTVAGDGTAAFLGDYVPSTGAQVKTPQGMSWMSSGHIVIGDYGNSSLRMVW